MSFDIESETDLERALGIILRMRIPKEKAVNTEVSGEDSHED